MMPHRVGGSIYDCGLQEESCQNRWKHVRMS